MYPSVRATIRDWRLDFGEELFVKNAALGGVNVGDDYYDQSVGATVWGDAQIHPLSPYGRLLQMSTPAAWLSGGSGTLYRRYVEGLELSGPSSWVYSEIGTPEGCDIRGYTKVGLLPLDTDHYWEFWYVDAADGMAKCCQYRTDLGNWASEPEEYRDYSDYASVAFFPMSYGTDTVGTYSRLMVVAVDPPFLNYKIIRYYHPGGSPWVALEMARTVMRPEILPLDAQWAGIGEAAGGSDWGWSHDADNRALVMNMGGDRAMSMVYDADSTHGSSDPFEILPSSEWGDMRCRVSGVNTVNGRIWATVERWAVGTDDIPYAGHTCLVSSGNGADWRDEGYVTDAPVRGKPIMVPGGDYLYIVGNASVIRAPACAQVGSDPDSMKYLLTELEAMNINYSGPGSAHQMTLKVIKTTDPYQVQAITPFLEAGNEVTIELGADGEYANYAKGTIVDVTEVNEQEASYWNVTCLGLLSKAIGAMSYKPMGARMYEGPYSLYSTFTLDNDLPRLTLAPKTGEWVNRGGSFYNERYSLYCKKPGRAILPHLIRSTSLMMRSTFMPTVSFEGVYVLLWYKDEDNYLKAGMRRCTYPPIAPWYWEFYVELVQDGEVQSNEPYFTGLNHLPVNIWYTVHASITRNELKVRFHPGGPDMTYAEWQIINGEDEDPPCDWFDWGPEIEFDDIDWIYSENFPPKAYSIGFEVEGFKLGTYEGALAYGNVDASGASWIQDNSYSSYPSSVIGAWLIVSGYERQVVSRSGSKLYVKPDFPAPPAVGSAYGVYPRAADGPLLPGCIFSDLFVYTGEHPWTTGLVMGNMLELAGLTPDESVRPVINVGPLQYATEDQYVHGSIDLVAEVAGPGYSSNPVIMYLWASGTQVDNEYHFSAYKLEIERHESNLYRVQSLGSGTSPYATETLIARHDNLADLSGYETGMNNTIRVIANVDYIAVYAGAELVTAFPLIDAMPGGYVSVESPLSVGGQAWIMEFREVVDSFIWDSGTPLSGALGRLLQGRRVKFIENGDGEIGVSRFEGDYGEILYGWVYIRPLMTELKQGSTIQNRPSIIGVEGARDRVYVLDRDLARRGVSNYERVDNPSITGGPLEALADAHREMVTRKGRAIPKQFSLSSPDPSIMLEDWFEDHEGTIHTIDSLSVSMAGGLDQTTLQFVVTTRMREELVTRAYWDSGYTYNSGKEYG